MRFPVAFNFCSLRKAFTSIYYGADQTNTGPPTVERHTCYMQHNRRKQPIEGQFVRVFYPFDTKEADGGHHISGYAERDHRQPEIVDHERA